MENEDREHRNCAQAIDVGTIFGGGTHFLCSGAPAATISPVSPSAASATSVLTVLPCAFSFSVFP
jgi:hypothetical protein